MPRKGTAGSYDSFIFLKGLRTCRRPQFDPWVGKIPWRRKWQPTPVYLPGKISWTEVGWSPWGCKESGRAEWLAVTYILFLVVATPIYTFTNSVLGFSFLHILNTCYFLFFWWQSFWQVWGDILLSLRFAFPW